MVTVWIVLIRDNSMHATAAIFLMIWWFVSDFECSRPLWESISVLSGQTADIVNRERELWSASHRDLNGNCVMNYERENRNELLKNSSARCFQSNRLSRIWLPSVVLFHFSSSSRTWFLTRTYIKWHCWGASNTTLQKHLSRVVKCRSYPINLMLMN